jgi:transposase-like protein
MREIALQLLLFSCGLLFALITSTRMPRSQTGKLKAQREFNFRQRLQNIVSSISVHVIPHSKARSSTTLWQVGWTSEEMGLLYTDSRKSLQKLEVVFRHQTNESRCSDISLLLDWSHCLARVLWGDVNESAELHRFDWETHKREGYYLMTTYLKKHQTVLQRLQFAFIVDQSLSQG